MSKRYTISKRFLIFWTLFIGIGAVVGATAMFIDPTGKILRMDTLLPYFNVLPFSNILFQNYIFSGIMLLIINGISNLISAILLLMNKKIGIILGMLFGITLMLWIIIQFIIFPFNFLSTSYFIFGLLQFITGYVCFVGEEQSMFAFNKDDYKNIGNDETKLVIYFSRQGYTKKLAYQIANEKGASILKIKTTEKIKGNLGFWWCGRFGMHKWGMNLEKFDLDITKFEEVIICSPIWVFDICAPIREFCKNNKGKINNVSYVITHFMNANFHKVAKKMDKLLDVKHKSFKSFKCHFGKLKEIK